MCLHVPPMPCFRLIVRLPDCLARSMCDRVCPRCPEAGQHRHRYITLSVCLDNSQIDHKETLTFRQADRKRQKRGQRQIQRHRYRQRQRHRHRQMQIQAGKTERHRDRKTDSRQRDR